MGVHYFHCCDGVDLIIDRVGRVTNGLRGIEAAALATATGLMRKLPTYDEWQNWSVYVYDACGEVAILPFPDDMRLLAAAA